MKPIHLKPDQSVVFVAPKDPKINEWGDKRYIEPPPYLPGEECYVREAWGSNMVKGWEGYGKIFYRADMPEQKTVPETYGCPWRSPVTMPQWAARRFVTIVSCEPMMAKDISIGDCMALGMTYGREFIEQWHKRHPDKQWAWRTEVVDVEKD